MAMVLTLLETRRLCRIHSPQIVAVWAALVGISGGALVAQAAPTNANKLAISKARAAIRPASETLAEATLAPASSEAQSKLLALKQSIYDDAVLKAFDAYRQGRNDEAATAAGNAILVAQKALVADKGWRAYYLSGIVLVRQNQDDEAIAQLRNALRRVPDDQQATVTSVLDYLNAPSNPSTTPSSNTESSLWTPQPPLQKHVNAPEAVAFSPDGSFLATGGWKNNGTTQISEIVLWDTDMGRPIRTMEGRWQSVWNGKGAKPPWIGHWGKVNSFAFSPDGLTLASGGEDGRTALWNVSTGAPVQSLEKQNVPVIGLSWTNPTSLAAITRTGAVLLFNPLTGQKQRTVQLAASASGNWVRDCAISHDGTMLATGEANGKITVWELPTGRLLRRFQNSQYQDPNQPAGVETTAMAFSNDGKLLVSANHAHVYINIIEKTGGSDGPAPKIYFAGQRVGQLKFSPDGETVYVVCDSKIDMLNLPDSRIPFLPDAAATTLASGGTSIRAIDVSSQGGLIGGGATNGAVVLWR